MRQTQYNVADLRISDHRPVFSVFDCLVDVVDHGLKDTIRRELYRQKQRDALSDSINLLDLEDEDNTYQDPIAPGLPPASSDRSKWWLDNGKSPQTQDCPRRHLEIWDKRSISSNLEQQASP
jgi:hypothetical protein